jgi:hypothetical protein
MSPSESARNEKRFWAFISYSHSDTKETEWLHKSLENFKIPPSLVGTESRTGVVPRRIFPVFRDRDELPTSADLGANLHSALRNARYLVVVCSPKSAKSIWVNAEVEFFKKTHGNSNVLCLIVGGTPGGSGEGDEAECFCPALRHHINPDGSTGQPAEPIAADLRDNKDGRLRAFLKIVAGILGVDFDALYQRERRRRRQRMIIAGSALALLAGVGLVFYQRLDTVAKSQSEIASEVKKMREMKFREFGKLPEARAQELEKIILDSGVLDSGPALEAALRTEAARFRRYDERLGRFTAERKALFGKVEAFIKNAEPSIGWSEAARVLSRLKDNPGVPEQTALTILNSNFGMANTMGRVSRSPQMKAELQTWTEALQLSEPFAEKLQEAFDLAQEMNAIDAILPRDHEVGSTEPQPGRDPKIAHANALNSAAWWLATDPDAKIRDPKKALEFAQKASDLTGGKSSSLLDTLAVAYAANGDFDSAIRWQTLAIERGTNESAEERAGYLARFKLYEQGKPFLEKTSLGMPTKDLVQCVANPSGLDSWAADQRSKLSDLEIQMQQFPASPEERVVVETELLKFQEAQTQLESQGGMKLNELRRAYSNQKSRAVSPLDGPGYKPLPELDGTVTASEMIWRKPADAPERGSLRESVNTIMGPDGTQKIVTVDREGSVELYCIKRFVFLTPDGKNLDFGKIQAARQFSRSASKFFAVHLN